MSNIWKESFSMQVVKHLGAGVVPRGDDDAATLEVLKNFAAQMHIDLATLARDAFARPDVVSDLQLLVFVLNKGNRKQLQRLFAHMHAADEEPFRLLWNGILRSTDDEGRCLDVADTVQCAASDLKTVRWMLGAALHMHQAQLKESGVDTPGLSPGLLMLEHGRQHRESVRRSRAQCKAADVAWKMHVQQRAASAALQTLLGRTVGELEAEGRLHRSGWAADHVLTPPEALEVLLEGDNMVRMSRCFSDNCFMNCYCQCHGGHVPASPSCVCLDVPRTVPAIDFGDAQRWPTAGQQQEEDDLACAWSAAGASGHDGAEGEECNGGGGGASGHDYDNDS